MRELVLIIFVSGLFFSLNAQQADLSISGSTAEPSLHWFISDADGVPMFGGNDFPGQDSILFSLEYGKRYFLNLSSQAEWTSDTILLNLYLNGQLIVAVRSDFGPGDRSVPFYTGASKKELRIVGGSNASISEFPWQVYFQAGNFLCGGSIISDRFILTAAHCALDEFNRPIDKQSMLIIAGATNPYSPFQGEAYEIRNYFIYEGFNTLTFEGDLALLELQEPVDVPFAEAIELITLADSAAGATDPGVMAWVTGWGLTSVDPEQFPRILQKVQLPIVSNSTASQVWGPIPPTFLMAGYNNGGKDACGGDSGGPLAVPVDGRYKLAGLVSWGSDQCNSYGGFVRVSSYLDWIEEVSGVGSLFRPASPLGDLIVCPAEQQSAYQTSISPPAQSFEWELQPAAAGTVESSGPDATVNWNPEYSGNTTLRVRAVRNDSLSGWSLININRPVETTITFQPGDVTICQNENVTLDIDAKGSDLLYTWFRDGAPVASGINSEYFIEDAQPDAGGVYAVEIEGTCGTVFSEEIDLTVHPLTEITSSSLTTRTYLGGSAVIEVQAVGNDLEYSWTKDNIPLEGINTPELFFTDADAEDIGRYRAVVSGTCGEEQSNSIYLYVSQDPGFTGSEENAILWPSLNDGEFFIALNSGRLYDVYLYDTSGKVAAIWEENQYNTRLVKRGLPTGVYIVRLLTEDYSQSFRIFIQ